MLCSQLRFIPFCMDFLAKLFPTRACLATKKKLQVKMPNTRCSAQAYNLFFFFFSFLFAQSTSEGHILDWKFVKLKFVGAFKIPLHSKRDFCTCSVLLYRIKEFLLVFQRLSKNQPPVPCPLFLPLPPPRSTACAPRLSRQQGKQSKWYPHNHPLPKGIC